jgi:DNA-binding NarL/FixJ family response regulator
MAKTASGPVLVAHHLERMGRIICLNLQAERIEAVAAANARESLDFIRARAPRAVVLDPEILVDYQDTAAVRGLIAHLAMPVLVLSDEPEHRRTAQLLGDAPFCNRPDDVDRVTAAVRRLLAGSGLPPLV